ncbi:MAG TPA: NUDIX hydrolase [Methylomirabilota bacterium]|nr:NUDIX hydrolase [Methylomirabilota bacterium]
MSDSREYPSVPRVGVGAVVLDDSRVLLVRRGKAPAAGKWSLPGGLVELGETTREAIAREITEECGLTVHVGEVAGVLDRVIRDADGRIRYHWVLVDYVAVAVAGTLCAATDVDEARWVEVDEVERLDTTDGLMDMIRRAQALAAGRPR